MNKKTTVNLTSENWEKVKKIATDTGLTQSEIINQAVADIPIINLGDQPTLAESFFELRQFIAYDETTKYEEGVNQICQSLNLLMEKIAELTHLNRE